MMAHRHFYVAVGGVVRVRCPLMTRCPVIIVVICGNLNVRPVPLHYVMLPHGLHCNIYPTRI